MDAEPAERCDERSVVDVVALCLERAEDEGEAVIALVLAHYPEHAEQARRLIETLRRIGLFPTI